MQLKMGFEWEFYLNKTLTDTQMSNISTQLDQAKLVCERGTNQYELVSQPFNFTNTLQVAQKVNNLQGHLKQLLSAADDGLDANFAPKPLKNDYGSALQVNVSIAKFDHDQYLNYIYCLLEQTHNFQTIINHRSGAIRLDSTFMAPTHIAWGGNNNRSVLVRALNLNPADLSNTRIEYRLANADADAAILIQFIFDCARISINQQIGAFPKIWGNCSDKQYNCRPLGILPKTS